MVFGRAYEYVRVYCTWVQLTMDHQSVYDGRFPNFQYLYMSHALSLPREFSIHLHGFAEITVLHNKVMLGSLSMKSNRRLNSCWVVSLDRTLDACTEDGIGSPLKPGRLVQPPKYL